MSLVELHNVTVDLPIYTVHARSIRRTLLNLSAGGRMMKDRSDRIFVRALDSISVRLNEGDRLGLVGHNGSGKSTLLRTIGGIYAPTSGSISVQGEISAALDLMSGIDAEATGEENITLLARYRGQSSAEVKAAMDDIAEFSELGPYLKVPVKTYSAGMIARLAFSVATSFQPDILLMDEWIATGDAHFIQKAQDRLLHYVSRSRTLVLASHNHSILRALCTKILVLDNGRVAAFGPVEDILPDPHAAPPAAPAEAAPLAQTAS